MLFVGGSTAEVVATTRLYICLDFHIGVPCFCSCVLKARVSAAECDLTGPNPSAAGLHIRFDFHVCAPGLLCSRFVSASSGPK